MSSSVSNLQLLNNTEHRVKFKTGSDINNLEDPIVGEMLVETSKQDDIFFDGQSKIDTSYTFGGGEISLSAWVKITSDDGHTIIATDSPAGGSDTSFAFGWKNSTTAYVLIGNPGQQIYQTSNSISDINDGNWHSIIITIDSGFNMKFHIDGVVELEHTFSILPGPSNYLTHYGSGWADGTEPLYDTWGLSGFLNGLGIWERTLNSTEISTIVNSGRHSPTPIDFSPNLWIGSTYPALHVCTSTQGEIKKVHQFTSADLV